MVIFAPMFAEIITIGDEILIGQIVDTNSAWLAKQLNAIGIRVKQITSISDSKEHIVEAVENALNRVDLVITTGGLGPTRDDITKRTLADYFDMPLVMNNDVLEQVKYVFESRGKAMPDVNRYQALVPEGCEVVPNKNGTAPGMWFPVDDRKVLVSMPGVPFEMKGLVTNTLIEKWKAHFKTPHVYHRTVLTQGVGESTLMGMIDKWEHSLDELEIKLAYLPSPGMVRLRLSATGNDHDLIQKNVDKKVAELEQLLGKLIFGYETDTLESVVGDLLKKRGETLSTAESCTGGYLAHLITSIPGSSAYYKGSVVSYANEVKMKELGVSEENLRNFGAVSEQVVIQMAEGIRKKMNTTYAIATSGIAGPDGGSEEKPVGTVWIAVALKDRTVAKKYNFGDNRERNIRVSAITGLNKLRKEILKGA